MTKKTSQSKYDFGTVLPIAEAMGILGNRVKVDKVHGYFLDGKPVKVFEVLKAAGKLPKEG